MIRPFVTKVLIVLLIAATEQCAWSHGIPFTITFDNNNKLYATSSVSYFAADSQIAGNPTGTPVRLRGTTAFIPQFGVVPVGTVLTVDSVGSASHPATMLYWDGTNILPSPVTVNMNRTGVNQNVTPTDTFAVLGALSAYNGTLGGHASINMDLPLGAPVGLYAFGYQVTAPGFGRSDTFWAIGNNGMSEAQAAVGVALIAQLVPEPSTWTLLLIALIILTAVSAGRQRTCSAAKG